ncbi:hypothetical protein [Pseudoramibacter alactolyticus]|uniref:hypothetical protein n=1 Tax=Pseudoramibacter alactolyticus TaxID=113287 RepID=UPI0012E9EEBD|nr:hypothetical protein [Pseudoramibacter alactolyticus]MBM6969316.1 hypothetical protein [Pseudoramibacter alactolyticus]
MNAKSSFIYIIGDYSACGHPHRTEDCGLLIASAGRVGGRRFDHLVFRSALDDLNGIAHRSVL